MKTGLAKNVLGIKSYEVKDRDVINKSKLYTGDIWFKMHKMGLQIACVHHILKTKNTEILQNWGLEFYLSKGNRQSMFSTWYALRGV